jgi:hypothetical protein
LVPATDRGALRVATTLARKKANSFSFDGFGLSKAIMRAVAESTALPVRSKNKRSQFAILAPRLTPHPGKIMRIFVFKSEANPHLRAFAGDLAGNQLPKQLGPWSATGAIAPDGNPPHNLSRDVIEAAIEKQGFQLWRRTKRDQSNPTE